MGEKQTRQHKKSAPKSSILFQRNTRGNTASLKRRVIQQHRPKAAVGRGTRSGPSTAQVPTYWHPGPFTDSLFGVFALAPCGNAPNAVAAHPSPSAAVIFIILASKREVP